MSKDNNISVGKHVVTTNREANFRYSLEDRYEAGLVLIGSEIKSIRDHKAQIADSYIADINGELWLMKATIARYDQAAVFGHAPDRPRKLLLHRQEIAKILGRMHERGYTVIPTQLYLKDGRAKLEIALAKGKQDRDKRQDIADREAKRDIARILKENR